MREVFIFAIEKGVILLNRCLGVLNFCKTPFVLYASIGDTLLAILAGLLIEYKTAIYSTKIINAPQMRKFIHDHPSELRIHAKIEPMANPDGAPIQNSKVPSRFTILLICFPVVPMVLNCKILNTVNDGDIENTVYHHHAGK